MVEDGIVELEVDEDIADVVDEDVMVVMVGRHTLTSASTTAWLAIGDIQHIRSSTWRSSGRALPRVPLRVTHYLLSTHGSAF